MMQTSGFTQKYTIVQFFDDVEVGYEYSSGDWPLHSTIVDTFAIDWPVEKMSAELVKTLQHHDIAISTAEAESDFGEYGQVPVVLLKRSDSLVKLHYDILAALQKGGLVLNDPQFARNGFRPHATIQKHRRLRKSEKVRFVALSIVDMFPDGNPYRRRIVQTIQIGTTL